MSRNRWIVAFSACVLAVLGVAALPGIDDSGAVDVQAGHARRASVPAEDQPPTTTSTTTTEPPTTVPPTTHGPVTTIKPRTVAPLPVATSDVTVSGLYLIKPDGTGLRRVVSGVVHHVNWSPKGDRLVYMREGALHVVNSAGGDDKVLGATWGGGAWNPAGTQVAYGGDGALHIVDVATGAKRAVVVGDFPMVDWSPDGTRLVFGKHGTMEVVDVDGSNRRSLATAMSQDGGLVWSPDSTRIAYLDWNRGPAIVAAATGAVTALVGQQNMMSKMSWSPDGTQVVFADYVQMQAHHLAVVGADGTDKRAVIDGGVSPAWSPDGALIVYQTYRNPGSNGRLTTELHIVGADGSGDRALTRNGRRGAADYADWSSDGALIAFAYNSG